MGDCRRKKLALGREPFFVRSRDMWIALVQSTIQFAGANFHPTVRADFEAAILLLVFFAFLPLRFTEPIHKKSPIDPAHRTSIRTNA
jgi:hypothetical protein